MGRQGLIGNSVKSQQDVDADRRTWGWISVHVCVFVCVHEVLSVAWTSWTALPWWEEVRSYLQWGRFELRPWGVNIREGIPSIYRKSSALHYLLYGRLRPLFASYYLDTVNVLSTSLNYPSCPWHYPSFSQKQDKTKTQRWSGLRWKLQFPWPLLTGSVNV